MKYIFQALERIFQTLECKNAIPENIFSKWCLAFWEWERYNLMPTVGRL
ncbi:MAG: hypothetical protein IKT84_08270 [Bacteroidales bacterium]|nr:hypothetical protein [Bacteroidales bacterium]